MGKGGGVGGGVEAEPRRRRRCVARVGRWSDVLEFVHIDLGQIFVWASLIRVPNYG
jgi:hypothetical protein